MRHTLLTLALLAAFSASASVAHHAPLTALPSATIAKHGADDPTGDDRGDHGSGHARRGADDPVGDDRGDHGSGHA